MAHAPPHPSPTQPAVQPPEQMAFRALADPTRRQVLALLREMQQHLQTYVAAVEPVVGNIRAGWLTVIDAAQFCGPLGAETMRAAYAVLRGENPPQHALVPVFPITQETLAAYPGWMGPVPASFAKPWPSVVPLWNNTLRVVTP